MDLIASRRGMIAGAEANAHDYAVVVVVGLNLLYGIRADNVVIGPITVAQREAHAVLFDAAFDLHARLVTSAESRDQRGWGAFEDRGTAPRLDLIAAADAVPDCAARCNPAKLIKGPLGDAIRNVHTIFPNPPGGLEHFSTFHSGDHREYITLTARQLRAGLLRLNSRCLAGASIFPVGKAGGKQRAVWNGTRVSLAAARPPAPLHLADPAAFGMLDLEASATLRVTKRDCKTWFDQLSVHPDIGLYFGRPRVTRSELHGEGLTDPDILAMGGEPGQPSFVPLSNVWPMGFSWSSCVAQATLLSICAGADLVDEQVLACDCPLPDSLDMAFAVATDDLMIFSDRGPAATVAAARAVEQVMLRHDIDQQKPTRTSTTHSPPPVSGWIVSMDASGRLLGCGFGP